MPFSNTSQFRNSGYKCMNSYLNKPEPNHSVIIATTMNSGPNAILFASVAALLTAHGHAVAFVSDAKPAITFGLTTATPVYYWPSKRPTQFADALFLRRVIRERGATCLIANFGAVSLMMSVGCLMGVPHRIAWYRTLSSQLHVDHPRGWFLRFFYRTRKSWVYRCATHCVANSVATKQDLIDHFQVPENDIHVHYNAVPIPHVSSTMRAKFKIVCPGRLEPSKGQEVLIRALASLRPRFPDLSVEFLGAGSAQAYYQQLASQLNVTDNCIFPGHVSQDVLAQRMAGSQIVIIPSLREAFGLVAAEAMSVATPVIASRTGGLIEVVKDGESGLLFDVTAVPMFFY